MSQTLKVQRLWNPSMNHSMEIVHLKLCTYSNTTCRSRWAPTIIICCKCIRRICIDPVAESNTGLALYKKSQYYRICLSASVINLGIWETFYKQQRHKAAKLFWRFYIESSLYYLNYFLIWMKKRNPQHLLSNLPQLCSENIPV